MLRACGWCNQETRSEPEWREHRERHTAEDRARLLERPANFDPVAVMERERLECAVIEAAVAYTNAASALGEFLKRGGNTTGQLHAFDESISKQVALFNAVDALVAARAAASPTKEQRG